MATQPLLKVYYDAACPRCIRDRERYCCVAGDAARQVSWVDANAQALRAKGIAPDEALQALHVEDEAGTVHRGVDAYILLMRRAPLLRPLAAVLGLPGLKGLLERVYRHSVRRRLRRQGRLP